MSAPAYKIVRLTSKRQFTIPKVYFDQLRLGDKAKCYLEGDRLVIEPIREDIFWDFSTDILRSLVAEGYQGEDLIAAFEARKRQAARALARMVEESQEEAEAGKGKPADVVFDELLGGEDV
jgi:bifunctional DNA-binding transcriptional regulator/antitoxin component of YhaV-PrlF toxin-antitoxin module